MLKTALAMKLLLTDSMSQFGFAVRLRGACRTIPVPVPNYTGIRQLARNKV